jgi:hypothetical protein
MRDRKSLRLRKYSHFSAIILVAAAFLSSGKEAAAVTADHVLNEMSTEEKGAYIAGLVDGLAYSRWLTHRPDDTAMQCYYSWFYGSGPEKWARIDQWFTRHLDKPAVPLLYVLIKKECGE